jgi:hypothetical protein
MRHIRFSPLVIKIQLIESLCSEKHVNAYVSSYHRNMNDNCEPNFTLHKKNCVINFWPTYIHQNATVTCDYKLVLPVLMCHITKCEKEQASDSVFVTKCYQTCCRDCIEITVAHFTV